MPLRALLHAATIRQTLEVIRSSPCSPLVVRQVARIEPLQDTILPLLHNMATSLPTTTTPSITTSTTEHSVTATFFLSAATTSPASDIISSFLTTLATLLPSSSAPSTTSTTNHTHTQISPLIHRLTLTLPSSLSLTTLRASPALRALEATHIYQHLLHATPSLLQPPLLAVFDLDSTLIHNEVIDLLAARAGPAALAAIPAITAAAMNGQIDFAASLRRRVALLRGLPADVWDTLKPDIVFAPGARELLRALKALGTRTAVLSGGFRPIAEWVAATLGIDVVEANELETAPESVHIEDADTDLSTSSSHLEERQTMTGRLLQGVPVVDSAFKKRKLLNLAEELGDAAAACVLSVGDGANDLPMLWAAGVGVAVNAKPSVQLDAPSRLNTESLMDVLALWGFGREQVEGLAAGAGPKAR